MAALVVVTTSMLVAARNFKSAWLMRALGETDYSLLVGEAMLRAGWRTYLVSLLGEAGLVGLLGAAVAMTSQWPSPPLAVGFGMIAYAVAVVFYSVLTLWRSRRG